MCWWHVLGDINEGDIPSIYKSCLTFLKTFKTEFGDVITATKLSTIEYCVHVAIIFNETWLNRHVSINKSNFAKHENNLRESLKYFENWKRNCSDGASDSNSFLPKITYNNLGITVCGFLAYARLVLQSCNAWQVTLLYVPALHSNTSSLESWFSLVRSIWKDTSHTYATVISTWNAASGINSMLLFIGCCKATARWRNNIRTFITMKWFHERQKGCTKNPHLHWFGTQWWWTFMESISVVHSGAQ